MPQTDFIVADASALADALAAELVMPVRVRRGAFADGVPCRDLWLFPDYAMFVDDMLVPIRQLINGATSRRLRATRSPISMSSWTGMTCCSPRGWRRKAT